MIESSRLEDLLLDKEALQNFDHECEDIYCLTQREISVLISCLRYADWESRWTNRDRDNQLIEDLKRKLLMLCARDLVKTNLLLLGAITGRLIPLSDDAAIEAMLTTDADFSEDGLVPVIQALAGGSPNLEDELLLIAGDIVQVAGILGAVA